MGHHFPYSLYGLQVPEKNTQTELSPSLSAQYQLNQYFETILTPWISNAHTMQGS